MIHQSCVIYLAAITALPTTLSTPPNIIIILADDLGFHDVSWHNAEIMTPTMEGLARSGIILENAYMQPMCTASRAALLTGYYPIHTGRQDFVIKSQEPRGLHTNFTLLSGRLRDMGYRTHAIGKWHLGYCHEDYLPTNRGFDSFKGLYGGWVDHYLYTHDATVGGGPDGYDYHHDDETVGRNDFMANNTYSTLFFADEAKRQIELHATNFNDSPLFLYLALTAPHTPLQAPAELISRYSEIKDERRRVYSAMVTGMDDAIGKVVSTLKEKGLYDNSIILFSSDNGGEFSHGSGGRNYPLRGEKNSVWEGGTRVPAFLHSPLIKKRGNSYNGLIHVTDWFPTLYSAAGGAVEDLGPIDGIDQWDTLTRQEPSKRTEMLYNSNPQGKQSPTGSAIRFGDMKLVIGDPGPGIVVKPERECNDDGTTCGDEEAGTSRPLPFPHALPPYIRLYDLGSDPSESHDVASYHPKLVEEMLERLAELESTALLPHVEEDVLEGNPNKNGGFYETGWCDLSSPL